MVSDVGNWTFNLVWDDCVRTENLKNKTKSEQKNNKGWHKIKRVNQNIIDTHNVYLYDL